MDKEIEQLQQIIDSSKNIVFLTGAGVSTESNIPDFRSADGLYNMKYDYPPVEILSHSFFMNHTDIFYDFYRDKMIYPDAKPNTTHYAIAKLEASGKCKGVITQNIDGLHSEAGSINVLEFHGTVRKNRCMNCNKFYDVSAIINSTGIPRCECGGIIKPEVVLFNEGIDHDVYSNSVRLMSKADTLIICGTSLDVHPASDLTDFFRGKNIVIINKDATVRDHIATLLIQKPLGEVWPQIKL